MSGRAKKEPQPKWQHAPTHKPNFVTEEEKPVNLLKKPIPGEILSSIVRFLRPTDILNSLSLTNKHFRNLFFNNERYWKEYLLTSVKISKEIYDKHVHPLQVRNLALKIDRFLSELETRYSNLLAQQPVVAQDALIYEKVEISVHLPKVIEYLIAEEEATLHHEFRGLSGPRASLESPILKALGELGAMKHDFDLHEEEGYQEPFLKYFSLFFLGTDQEEDSKIYAFVVNLKKEKSFEYVNEEGKLVKRYAVAKLEDKPILRFWYQEPLVMSAGENLAKFLFDCENTDEKEEGREALKQWLKEHDVSLSNKGLSKQKKKQEGTEDEEEEAAEEEEAEEQAEEGEEGDYYKVDNIFAEIEGATVMPSDELLQAYSDALKSSNYTLEIMHSSMSIPTSSTQSPKQPPIYTMLYLPRGLSETVLLMVKKDGTVISESNKAKEALNAENVDCSPVNPAALYDRFLLFEQQEGYTPIHVPQGSCILRVKQTEEEEPAKKKRRTKH